MENAAVVGGGYGTDDWGSRLDTDGGGGDGGGGSWGKAKLEHGDRAVEIVWAAYINTLFALCAAGIPGDIRAKAFPIYTFCSAGDK